MQAEKCTLFSSGLKGAESAFGEAAEKWGVREKILSFAGHKVDRKKNVEVLAGAELQRGDISMELASKMMNRTYYETEKIRQVLQIIFHLVNRGHQVFAVGTILENDTVKGGTGWAVELARLFNRPVSVYDQERRQWYTWHSGAWQPDSPRIAHETFVGTGTRNLSADGARAIESLFADAFGAKD